MFKGLRNYEENNSVPDDQVYDCNNARFRYYVIASKLGWTSLGDRLSSGTKSRGLYEYPYEASGVTDRRLLSFYNKSFYQYNSTTDTWSIITTTWPDVADQETQGLLYNNIMYFINPMEGVATPSYYNPAYLTGGTAATTIIATWVAVTNGSFSITIDGVVRNVSSLDFSGCTTMAEVAIVIQTGIRALTSGEETVEWDLDHFIISSANRTSSSAITVTSATGGGTDISGVGTTPFMDAESGQGTVTATSPAWAGIGKISNGTFSVVENSPRGTAIESWVERIWAIGDKTAPNAVIASRPASAAHPTYVEDWTTNPILELIGKGGKCVAIRVLNNELFVWKQDSIWYNTVDRIAANETPFVELSRTGGAVNQKSTIVVENDVWFLTPSLEVRSLGLERQLGNNPRTRELTSAIQRIMNILDPDQSNAVASYYKRVYKLSLKTYGSTTNNLTIVFDYDTSVFSIDVGQSIDTSVVWNNQLVFCEDSQVGQAYKDETGYTANGAAYSFDFKTPFIDGGRPDLSARARYIYVKGKQSYDQEVKVRLYREGDYSQYSEYTIPSPRDRGVSESSNVNDGQFGSREYGDQQFGGDSEDSQEIALYKISNDPCGEYLISIDRRCNMFALGVNAQINASKVIIQEMGLKVIDDNENYKRANL